MADVTDAGSSTPFATRKKLVPKMTIRCVSCGCVGFCCLCSATDAVESTIVVMLSQ
jgi:DTW domain-containing protein YfiP